MTPTVPHDHNPAHSERQPPDLGADPPDLSVRLPEVLGEAALRQQLDWQEVEALLLLVEGYR